MSIIVQTPPADKPGPDVYTFLKDPTSMLVIGSQLINENSGESSIILDIERKETNFIKPGSLVKILVNNKSFIGKVLSFELSVSMTTKSISVSSVMSVEVPK